MPNVTPSQAAGGLLTGLQNNDIYIVQRLNTVGYIQGLTISTAISTAVAVPQATANQALALAQSLQSAWVLEPNGWDAAINTPALSDATGVQNQAYVVNVTGTIDLGSGSKTFTAGTVAYFAGGVWNPGASVSAGVQSFNGRQGTVVPANGDYTASQITNVPSGNLTSITVQAALNELQTELDAIPSGGVITVGDSRITPQVFEDGTNSSGDGTARLLNSLTNPDTGVAYTNSSAATMFPDTAALWGSIDVTTATYDDVVLQEMMLSFQGSVKAVYCDNKYFVVNLPHDKIVIPASSLINGNITNFKANQIGIFGGYSAIRVNNATANKTIFWRQATSLANASNGNQNFINKKVHIDGWVFIGQSGTNTKAVSLWASYNSIIENCDFNNMDIDIDARFCLGMTIRNNNFFNTGTTCIYQNLISSADWADVSNPGAQTTSQILIEKNRFSCGNGVIGVYARGMDSGKVIDNIFETPGASQAFAGVYYDYGGSNNSKGIVLGNNHLEGEITDAWYRLRMGGNCTAVIDLNYEQSPVLENAYLVNLSNETGSNTVIIRDQGNHSGAQWKLKYAYPAAVSGVPGGGGGFVFQNTMLIGNPQTPAAVQGNSSVFKLDGTDPLTGYNFVSPQTGSNRIKVDPRPL